MNTQNPGAPAYTPPVSPVAGERITLEGDASPNSLVRLLHQYRGGHVRWLNSGTTWVTEDAKAWLARNIGAGDRVLEFGAGRSTIFFTSQASRGTTVEGSPRLGSGRCSTCTSPRTCSRKSVSTSARPTRTRRSPKACADTGTRTGAPSIPTTSPIWKQTSPPFAAAATMSFSSMTTSASTCSCTRSQ